jgi:uncharacterized protein YbjT (DUF2867 family)
MVRSSEGRGTVEAFVNVALKNGVRRLVLLSGRGEEGALLAERTLQHSGADWTILRSSWFSQNFSEGLFLEEIKAGELTLPAGDVKEPFVDADDIADIAVAALTDERHIGGLYELTGPRLLTFAEAVQEIAEATDREIRYTPISLEEYQSLLTAQHIPTEFLALVNYLFSQVLDGRNASVADGVQRALRRPPRDFSEYARAAAASGVWTTHASINHNERSVSPLL